MRIPRSTRRSPVSPSPVKTRPARLPPPRVDRHTSKIVGRIARKFGFVDPRLIERWPDIVGQKLADAARPVKVTRRSGRGLLIVRVPHGPAAAQIQHMTPMILERLNRHLGAGFIDELRIEQGGAMTTKTAKKAVETPRPRTAPPAAPTSSIAEALDRLRAHVKSRSRS